MMVLNRNRALVFTSKYGPTSRSRRLQDLLVLQGTTKSTCKSLKDVVVRSLFLGIRPSKNIQKSDIKIILEYTPIIMEK